VPAPSRTSFSFGRCVVCVWVECKEDCLWKLAIGFPCSVYYLLWPLPIVSIPAHLNRHLLPYHPSLLTPTYPVLRTTPASIGSSHRWTLSSLLLFESGKDICTVSRHRFILLQLFKVPMQTASCIVHSCAGSQHRYGEAGNKFYSIGF